MQGREADVLSESRNSASWQVGVWHEESGEPWWPSPYTGQESLSARVLRAGPQHTRVGTAESLRLWSPSA